MRLRARRHTQACVANKDHVQRAKLNRHKCSFAEIRHRPVLAPARASAVKASNGLKKAAPSYVLTVESEWMGQNGQESCMAKRYKITANSWPETCCKGTKDGPAKGCSNETQNDHMGGRWKTVRTGDDQTKPPSQKRRHKATGDRGVTTEVDETRVSEVMAMRRCGRPTAYATRQLKTKTKVER